jgi:hypothetical protein
MKRAHLLTTLLLAAWPVTSGFSQAPAISGQELLAIDNGTVKIGIDRARGASITWLSWSAHSGNTVNYADPGRLIQQSYYAGRHLDRKSEGQHRAWSPWTWNPIQGGGVGSWARVTKFEHRDNKQTLFGETIPKLWDMADEEADAVMRQWTSFEPEMPNVVVVRCEFVASRKADDRWGPAALRPQEIPACYFTRKFDTFKSYLGDGEWRDEAQPPGPPWGKADPPRNTMACFSADGQGIAVFSPGGIETWNFGPHAGGKSGDPADGPCVHMAPIVRVNMGPTSTLRYRYWLIVGNESEITERLDRLWAKYSDERVELSNPQPKPQTSE